jgi:hypothetical protein
MDTLLSDRLAKRRYRFGWRLFTGATIWLRWWLLTALVLAPIGSMALANVVESGLWPIVATVVQWFTAVTAGLLIYANLPLWISRGCTRREITVAFAVFGALTSVAVAALITAGFAAEHGLLALTADAPRPWGETVELGVRYLLITPVYFFTGTFIGAAAARFGGRPWFTATVLIGAAVHYAGILALEFDVFGREWATAPWAGLTLAATAALIAAYALALRSIPVQAKRA